MWILKPRDTRKRKAYKIVMNYLDGEITFETTIKELDKLK